jgi:hypothetical protein
MNIYIYIYIYGDIKLYIKKVKNLFNNKNNNNLQSLQIKSELKKNKIDPDQRFQVIQDSSYFYHIYLDKDII